MVRQLSSAPLPPTAAENRRDAETTRRALLCPQHAGVSSEPEPERHDSETNMSVASVCSLSPGNALESAAGPREKNDIRLRHIVFHSITSYILADF